MESGGERQPPNSLRLAPRGNSLSQPGMISSPSAGSSSNPQGMATPVSPSIGIIPASNYVPMGPIASPQASMGSHSRNPSVLDDAYVPMQSPGTQGPQVTQGQSGESSPYLEMGGPGPATGVDKCRITSTPTPIPLSPSDGKCFPSIQLD